MSTEFLLILELFTLLSYVKYLGNHAYYQIKESDFDGMINFILSELLQGPNLHYPKTLHIFTNSVKSEVLLNIGFPFNWKNNRN